jgi:hypothetical protein
MFVLLDDGLGRDPGIGLAALAAAWHRLWRRPTLDLTLTATGRRHETHLGWFLTVYPGPLRSQE